MNEQIKNLQDIYPVAPEEVLEECISLAERHSLDPLSRQVTIYESEQLGRWCAKITRHGYRKIASNQPGYQGHHYLSLYRGDKFTIKDNDILLEACSEARGYSDLSGAIAYLYDGGRLYFVRISYADYSRQKYAWDQATGKPDLMLQKEAEIAVIQKAYAPLFWGERAESQEVEEESLDNTRADILSYIKSNSHFIKNQPPNGLARCTIKELLIIKNEIMAAKDES